MINPKTWMPLAVSLLREQFGTRLLFVGLQGSHRRGEAREDSDIDILTILDSLTVDDLARYRSALRKLPEGEKAGGFTCGRDTLLAWPPFELFQFAKDTDSYLGNLDALLPPVSRQDIITGARAGVSGIHHLVAYLYISGDPATRADDVKGLYKSFFFSIQLMEYLRSGIYAGSKTELLTRLSGEEATLLRLGMDPEYYEERKQNSPDSLFQLLLEWSGNAMQELAERARLESETHAR